LEVQRSADIFEWYGEEARRTYGRVLAPRATGQRLTVTKEPVGPVAAFGPWNFPTGNPGRKLGAAIAAGCPVIMKPAEEAPCAALEMARCLIDAGVPKGVCSIVFGPPAEVSAHLLASKVIRKMSFTGSTRVGKQLAALAAQNMIRTTMELGGHAPVLVFGDVDLEHVLDLSVIAKFRNAGQVCVSPTRFYVHDSLYTKFVQGFAARAKALIVGNGLVETNRMGPLAHAGRAPFIEPLIDDARQRGAKVHAGGADSVSRRAKRRSHHERGAVRAGGDGESVCDDRRSDCAREPAALRSRGLCVHEFGSGVESYCGAD
jgi:succinate-semialdehyde dehydrogenase/glutarate-semialdehyde dehydrogenase